MHVGDLVLRAFGWKARKFKVLLQVGPVPQAPAVAPDEPGFESWFTCPFPRGPQTCHQSLLSLIVFIHSFVRSFTDVQHHLCTRCHVSMCGGDDRQRGVSVPAGDKIMRPSLGRATCRVLSALQAAFGFCCIFSFFLFPFTILY